MRQILVGDLGALGKFGCELAEKYMPAIKRERSAGGELPEQERRLTILTLLTSRLAVIKMGSDMSANHSIAGNTGSRG